MPSVCYPGRVHRTYLFPVQVILRMGYPTVLVYCYGVHTGYFRELWLIYSSPIAGTIIIQDNILSLSRCSDYLFEFILPFGIIFPESLIYKPLGTSRSRRRAYSVSCVLGTQLRGRLLIGY
ncbi:hypothetical protein T310_2097 [Rasamsonia emersonii CBS 393.64]|uniref:Uncharacterized protein n=1 Tax=Rasamsonia emersonii (strain ATCC 16479 / CBS 393.64 / IMI 116815) TaxID=1408163 RepID=A0A0F4Z188_RASE3|nr:hypothetical protein T310_2097 [Rasamsonia emersonii CBS 393.64]KKA23866.1 hypothetical protein T310_2097 [Rasamsonia emersonii CBS 393.64]